MRILVVGAGAIGGYFGGRLAEAGRDVTFLVRPRRAEQLRRGGPSIRSPLGNFEAQVQTVLSEDINGPAELVLVGCKAYDLAGAMDSFAPAVGPRTAILPLLNGMRHLDLLERRFGRAAVLGGQCLISTTLDDQGRVLHLNDSHSLSFGERDGSTTDRVQRIELAFGGAKFDARASSAILQEMWDKWVFIAAAAGITCLMRSAVGDIVAGGGADIAESLPDECASIAAAEGFPTTPATLQRSRAILTASGSAIAASMLRDIQRNARTEGEHVLGDLLRRGSEPKDTHSLLRIVCTHLRAYEAWRVRTQEAAGKPE